MRSFFRSRRPFKLTKGGWIFILYAIGVGAGAINTGNNLLYLVFGLFLGLILASGVLSDFTLWGMEAVPLSPHEGRVGEPLVVPFSLRNTKRWLPSLGIRLEVRGMLNGVPVTALAFCTAVKPGDSVDALPVLFPGERGVLTITDVVFSTRFPFGLLFKYWSRPVIPSTETVVLPRLLKEEPSVPLSSLAAISADESSVRRGEGPTLFGIRDFQNADNPRRIHWKASAKRDGAWLVREMEEEEMETARLLWPDPLPEMTPAELELFVSYTASLVESLKGQGRRVTLFGGSESFHWQMEDDGIGLFLALVRPGFNPRHTGRAPSTIGTTDLYAAFRSAEKSGVLE